MPHGNVVNYSFHVEGSSGSGRQFSHWLHGQLLRRQWTAADLSRRLNMPSGTVSRWLSGERRPSPQSCDLLADAFQVNTDDVLALAGHRVPPQPLPPDDPKRRIITLVKRAPMSPQQAAGLEAMLLAWIETASPTPNGA